MTAESLTIEVPGSGAVSALLERPDGARGLYVLAHGAGAGMRHPFLEQMSHGLAAHGVATLRYNFLYMERKAKRPDPPAVAFAAVRAAVSAAAAAAPGVPLFAGGKSFGGRMTSGAQAEAPLPGVRGLIFLGFPLHPPGKPATGRADHLARVTVPMLFLQGSRDDFARLDLLEPLVRDLGDRATLHLIPEGDHSFHVPKKTGRTDALVLEDLAAVAAQWMAGLSPAR